jgi:hypothetical protein
MVNIRRACKKNISAFAAVDRIIDHLKLPFVAEKPPPDGLLRGHLYASISIC